MNKEFNNTEPDFQDNSDEKSEIIKGITDSYEYKMLKSSVLMKEVYMHFFTPFILESLTITELIERAQSIKKIPSFTTQLVQCIRSGNGPELTSKDYPDFSSQGKVQKTLKKISLAHKITNYTNISEKDALKLFSDDTVKSARECFESLPRSVTGKQHISENEISACMGDSLYCVPIEEFEAIHKDYLDYSEFVDSDIKVLSGKRSSRMLFLIALILICLGVPFCLWQFDLISTGMMIVLFFLILAFGSVAIFNDKKIKVKNEKNTGEYLSRIERASISDDRSIKNFSRKYSPMLIMVAVCMIGVLYGIYQKQHAETRQLERYIEDPNSVTIDLERLENKGVYDLYVNDHLGNNPSQSLFGGYFYSGDDLLIYPDDNGSKTIIDYLGKEHNLSENLADNINVRGECVTYRDTVTREIYEYDISTNKAVPLGIKNAGQLVVCDKKCYYIDLGNKSALVRYDIDEKLAESLIESDVKEFVIAGTEILYLNKDSELCLYDLKNNESKVIEERVLSFAYNGFLWIQNNGKIYKKTDDDYKELNIEDKCNRLLGMTESLVAFETTDDTILFNIDDNTKKSIGNDIIIGASPSKILCYSISSNEYNMIYID